MTAVLETEGLPVPAPDRDTEAFWQGTADQKLLVQHCQHCGRWIWQPRPLCPTCHHDQPQWEEISGHGLIASWIVPHPPVLPALADVTPYAVLLVDLGDGIRMIGMLTDSHGALIRAEGHALDEVQFGREVALRWRQQRGWTLPCWMLSSEAS
jgi:uncharacterized protein